MSMVIETAKPSDAEAILRLQRLAFQAEAGLYQDWNIPPLTESLEALLASLGSWQILKAIVPGSLVLVGSVRAKLDGGTCSIGRLMVHPEWQHQGIGRALMSEVEHHFPQARCFEVFTGHKSARNLTMYQRLGYVPCGEQRVSDRLTLIFLRKPAP